MFDVLLTRQAFVLNLPERAVSSAGKSATSTAMSGAIGFWAKCADAAILWSKMPVSS